MHCLGQVALLRGAEGSQSVPQMHQEFHVGSLKVTLLGVEPELG